MEIFGDFYDLSCHFFKKLEVKNKISLFIK